MSREIKQSDLQSWDVFTDEDGRERYVYVSANKKNVFNLDNLSRHNLVEFSDNLVLIGRMKLEGVGGLEV